MKHLFYLLIGVLFLGGGFTFIYLIFHYASAETLVAIIFGPIFMLGFLAICYEIGETIYEEFFG